MTNKEYIDKYKNDNFIIANNYTDNSKIINDIVVPLDIDNRHLCSPTDNQGSTPHCTGYSCAQYLEAIIWKKTGIPVQLDAHQIYAKAKELDGRINEEGSQLNSALQAGINLCNLKNCEIRTYINKRTQKTITDIKHLIHKYDLLLAGFNITSGWYNCNQTNYKISHTNFNMGGHAVVLAGYSDAEGGFIIENQWGINWGAKGFGIIPYNVFLNEFIYCAYLTNLYDNID